MSKGGKHGKREDGRRRGKGEGSGKAERQERIFQREEGGKRQGENMKRGSPTLVVRERKEEGQKEEGRGREEEGSEEGEKERKKGKRRG